MILLLREGGKKVSSSGTVRATLLVAAAPAEPCAGPCVGGKDRRARYSTGTEISYRALTT